MPPGQHTDWLELAALSESARVEAVRARLEQAGVAEAKAVAKSFAGLLSLPIFAIAAERVSQQLRRAGSPRRAMLALEDCVQNLESTRGDASPLFIDPILPIFIELAGSSARAARLLSADPRLAIELGAQVSGGQPPAHVDMKSALDKIVAASVGDSALFDRRLRRFRNRQMLRIALCEIRDADVRHTSAELADLASAAFQAALDHHLPALEGQHGKLDPPNAHVIIGMGKLGGRELNFSSDVDVIYLYEHDQGGAGALSAHQLHLKLFERVSASLSRITELGFVFRVDLDLRPEGKQGALANSLASAERYYETWGRTWERAAWIKARAIAGDAGLGARTLQMMRPFVYRKSFDLSAIGEIVEMKAKIDAARKRAQLSAMSDGLDLKLGSGGIREIEFYCQAHQLLHGGRDARLRVQNTLEGLRILEASGLVSARARTILSDAYLLMRKVEHRIQIVEEQQTHVLPNEPGARASLARSLGYANPEALLSALEATMRGVHELFSGLLGASEAEDVVPPEIELLFDPAAEVELRLAVLDKRGTRAPHEALANLSSAARSPRSPLHRGSPEERRRIALRLVLDCLESPSPDRALRHLPELLRAMPRHASYLELLDRPAIRRGVARLLGASDLLARILVRDPALLSQVLVAESLPPADAVKTELEARLAQAPGDIERAMAVLRSAKQEDTLRTAVAEMAGALDTAGASQRLTALAELLVECSLGLAERETRERYGAPKDPGAELCLVAGGTLGARELGYRSDLDLSAIYRGQGETAGGTRPAISVGEYYTRIVQRLLSFLTLRTHAGDLYPVDMRLRPSGNQGALVTSLSNFRAYHQNVAQLWERQALVRSRPIAGPFELRSEVERAIRDAAYGPGPVEGAAAKVREMYERLVREKAGAKKHGDHSFDLKMGRGGLVECEFLVQFLLLQNGRAIPQIQNTETRSALLALGQVELLPAAEAVRLTKAYDRLRRLQSWLRVAHDEMLDRLGLSPESLRPLALAVGYQGSSAETLLARELESDTESIHASYARVLC